MGDGGEWTGRGGRLLSSRNHLSGPVLGPSVQAGVIYGGVWVDVRRPPLPTPTQLPLAPYSFVGRHRELTAFDDHLALSRRTGQPTLVVISGMGGVGKTSLALSWLHRIGAGYTDGQLYADLRGFAAGPPVSPVEALGSFVRALGVAPEDVPAGLEERAALFRSLTAGRRVALLLDDAVSADQVLPLLPGATSDSLVVVTTRSRLSGLATHGALFRTLDPLDEAAAVDLLTRLIGPQRIADEPEAARALAALCGHLPLALSAAGARLAARPRWPVGLVADELADERHRLAALSTEDGISVEAAFDASYAALPREAQRLYRLLGLQPGPELDVAAASAEALRLLDLLVGAHLLEERSAHRFRFHDLVLLHARGKAA